MGDLRWDHEELTKGDPGFIYRTPEETYISIPAKVIEPLIAEIIGSFLTPFFVIYLLIVLVVLIALLGRWSAPRTAAFVFLFLALSIAAAFIITLIDRVYW